MCEFNIQVDPEAAKIVLESGLATMVPLEVTHTALVTPDVLRDIDHLGPSPFTRAIHQLLLFFASTYKDVFDFEHPVRYQPLRDRAL